MAMSNVEMPKLCWDSADQVRAFEEWKDFMESYLFISKVEAKDQWHYIKLSAGPQVKDLWDSWQLSNDEKKDPAVVFKKFAIHFVET